MRLDIHEIRPEKGTMQCNLWENSSIGLPLTLYYSIEIPLEPFNSGHDYVEQPVKTNISIEWIKFTNKPDSQNERNWQRLVGRTFTLSYNDESAEGSIYLGLEHCQFNSHISFLSLSGTVFEIELILNVDFNIETVNLPKNGNFAIRTELDFQGLLLYPDSSLPTVSSTKDVMKVVSNFIDINSYYQDFANYDNPNVKWRQLKPNT